MLFTNFLFVQTPRRMPARRTYAAAQSGGSGNDVFYNYTSTGVGPTGPPGPQGVRGLIGPPGPQGEPALVNVVPVSYVNKPEYSPEAKDYFLSVDTSETHTIITLPLGIVGTVYVIKDSFGTASSNPITILCTDRQLIDGLDSVDINTNFSSLTFIFNGVEWNIVAMFNDPLNTLNQIRSIK